MTEGHRSRIGILQQRGPASSPQQEGVARPAARSAVHEPLLAVVRLSSAVLIRPVAMAVRLLVGSRSNRVSGYRRSGYPEMDHWTAGRRRGLDK